jgi:hypothetical protein
MRRESAALARWIARPLVGIAVAVGVSACVIPPTAAPPPVQTVSADARALRYGASAAEIMNHPALRDGVVALYQAEGIPRSGLTALGAPPAEFFARTESLRLLRVGDRVYIAAVGCSPPACATRRGLLLVREDGGELLSRLDEGGFSHYYVHGAGITPGPGVQALLDEAWWVSMRAAIGGHAVAGLRSRRGPSSAPARVSPAA